MRQVLVALEELYLEYNEITDAGAAKIVAAMDAGGLPKLVDNDSFLKNNAATAAAVLGRSSGLPQFRLPQ